MKLDRNSLVKNATAAALRTRKKFEIPLWDPTNVYDVAEKLGVEVRFLDIPSMEGVYVNGVLPSIIISSLRPPGRQFFTCAHELGHHILEHGEQYDELVGIRTQIRPFDPKEFQADCFAGSLLMPKIAVSRIFSLRQLSPKTCAPEALYVIANWFGVGYNTLIHHMAKALKILSPIRANSLLQHRPIKLRSKILGRECRNHLIIIDHLWDGRCVDTQATDILHLPPRVTIEGVCVEELEAGEKKTLARAVRPGTGRIMALDSSWSVRVRVSRKQYIGRGKYRFEEDISDDE